MHIAHLRHGTYRKSVRPKLRTERVFATVQNTILGNRGQISQDKARVSLAYSSQYPVAIQAGTALLVKISLGKDNSARSQGQCTRPFDANCRSRETTYATGCG